MGVIYMKKTHRKLAREKAVFAIYQWRLIAASLEEIEMFLETEFAENLSSVR